MSLELEQVKNLLKNEDHTVVIYHNGAIVHSELRGVRPLLDWLDSGIDLSGASVADKVVGRGAAFLYRLLGVREVFGRVMSVGAVKVLRAGGIEATWGNLTETIMNRQKNGPCPIELATRDIQVPENALFIIRSTLEQLKG